MIFVDGYKVPLMIQKSDGGFGYGTTDMAAIRQRIQQEKGDFLVYVTDAGQASHFELVFGAARKAGYVPADGSVRVAHVGFGVVLNEDGSRIKTRAGEVTSFAAWLLTCLEIARLFIRTPLPHTSCAHSSQTIHVHMQQRNGACQEQQIW